MHDQISDVDMGWLAGLYEGEGSCGVYGRGCSAYIAMTDADVLRRVQALFPSPQGIRVRQRIGIRGHNKPLYEWRLRRRDDVAGFLRLVLPLLGTRRTAQAMKVLARVEDPRGGLGSGHRNKTHCPHGHPYNEENTRRNSGNNTHRRCKACERIYTKRVYWERKREKAR